MVVTSRTNVARAPVEEIGIGIHGEKYVPSLVDALASVLICPTEVVLSCMSNAPARSVVYEAQMIKTRRPGLAAAVMVILLLPTVVEVTGCCGTTQTSDI